MTPDRIAAISFGATLAVVVALRLNTAGMLLVATLLLGALLLCPLLAMRALADTSLPVIRVERPARAALSGPRATPHRALHGRRRPARRGGWPAWPTAHPLVPPKRWTAVGAVATPRRAPVPPSPQDNDVPLPDQDL